MGYDGSVSAGRVEGERVDRMRRRLPERQLGEQLSDQGRELVGVAGADRHADLRVLGQGVEHEVLVRRHGVEARPGVQLRAAEPRQVPLDELGVAGATDRVGGEAAGVRRRLRAAHVLAQLGGDLPVDGEAVEVVRAVPHEDREPGRRELPQMRRGVVGDLFLGDRQRQLQSGGGQHLVRPRVAGHHDPVGPVGRLVGLDRDAGPVGPHRPHRGVRHDRRSVRAGQGHVHGVGPPGVDDSRFGLVEGLLAAGEVELGPALHHRVGVEELVVHAEPVEHRRVALDVALPGRDVPPGRAVLDRPGPRSGSPAAGPTPLRPAPTPRTRAGPARRTAVRAGPAG